MFEVAKGPIWMSSLASGTPYVRGEMRSRDLFQLSKQYVSTLSQNLERKVANSAAPTHVHPSHAAHKAAGVAACIPTTHPHRAGPCGLRCALPSCSTGKQNERPLHTTLQQAQRIVRLWDRALLDFKKRMLL